jgi:hypothetical protein
MKLEQDPFLNEGPSFMFTLKTLFRRIAQVVNGKAEGEEMQAALARITDLEARVTALENS